MRFSCALMLTTDILMHAAEKGVGAVRMLRMTSNSVARSCQRELSQMVFWKEHQVVATLCKLANTSSVSWQLIATRRSHCSISLGVLECVMCAGDIPLRRLHLRSENDKNRDLIVRSQGPQGMHRAVVATTPAPGAHCAPRSY